MVDIKKLNGIYNGFCEGDIVAHIDIPNEKFKIVKLDIKGNYMKIVNLDKKAHNKSVVFHGINTNQLLHLNQLSIYEFLESSLK